MNKTEFFLQKLTLQGLHLSSQEGRLRCAGPQQRITDEVLNQLKERKAELLQYLRQPTYSPPSAGQSGLWFIHQQRPENSAYTVSLAYRILSALDVELLGDTIQLLINRHAALRTRFIWQEDALVQQIDGYQAAAIERIEAYDWNETTLLQQVRTFHERPFDLSTGPLFRVTIFNHTGHGNLGQSYTLLLSVHHIVVDGWSIYQLVDELFTFYNALRRGVVVELPLIQATYADYVAWQQTLLETEGERLYKVWQAQLQGELPVLQLPTDYSRPPQQTLRGISQPLHLSSTLTEQVKRLARQNNCTLYMVLLAAYQVLLHRYSGQEEILIGLPMAGRSRPEFAEIIGYFTSPVVARANINASSTFAHLLVQVKGQVLAALDHQDYPFVRLVQQLNPQRDVSRSPIFQASFVLQKPHRVQELLLHANRSEQFGLTLEPIPLPLCAGQDEIGLELAETSAGLVGALKGNADLFAQTTLARMAEHFQVLLAGIVAESPLGVNQPIVELPMLTAAERQQLLVEWNATATDYPQDQCIHHLFEAQVERTPEAIAVVFDHQRLTYAELNTRANQLAHHLQSLGMGSDVLVGICVERSIEMVVGLLAIFKAGGAYVPLDPSYPAERLAFMLQDVNPPVLLTQARLLGQLPATTSKVVCLDLDWEEIATHGHDNPVSQVQADHLAYVIYTSGSTGRPKGTRVTHRNVVRLVQNTNFAQLTAEETFLQLAPIAFDAATLEIWGPLLNGGRLVVMKPGQPSLAAIGEAILHNGVTTLWLTAGLFHLMVEEQIEALRPLRQLLAGGDVLSVTHVKRFLQRIPTCRLINGYGPTENTTFTCCFPITHTEGIVTSVPIGRPIANTQAYILDPRLQPVPIGVAGELYAGGDGVAHGYLNRPDLTEEKFIANPFGEGKLYKTGDLARWLPDGNIEFLGRLDQQVKIRGFRIELGEIEAVLTQHPAVQEAVVIVREDESPMGAGEKCLVAYVVTKTEAGDGRRETHDRTSCHQSQALRHHLQAKLPDYMLPSAFVLLDALPLTPNGKVDRKALPAPMAAVDGAHEQVAPRTATEATLVAIWREVLHLQAVGIDDNFFALGGHSLLATQVVSRIRQALAVELPLRTFLQAATVRTLAEAVSALQQQQQALRPPLTAVSRSQALPLSFAQVRMWFLAQMEGSNRAYHIPLALQVTGSFDVMALQQSWQAVVARHETLRTRYRLLDGMVYQEIVAEAAVDLSVERLAAATERSIERWLAERTAAPFDLAADSPWRLHLLQVSDAQHILLLVLHHIAADGWSLDLLWREWRQCYSTLVQGQAIALPPLPLQYADYAVWQRQWLQGETLAQQLAFWQQHLAGAPSLLELPTDHPRPAVQSYRGAALAFRLDAALSQAIETLCVRQAVTPFMTLLTAFQVLLHRYSGQDDIVVGTPIANRTQLETEGMVGMFVNTLALRSQMKDNPTFSRLLNQVRTTTQAAYDQQALPFELLVDALQPERSLSHAPLFQVMFVLQNHQQSDLTLPAAQLRYLEAPVTTTKFDLTLTLWQQEEGMAGWWEYNTDLFEPATIERMVGHFQTLLTGIVANPDQRLSDLPLLTQAERHQLLVEWNDTATAYRKDQCIHHLFEEQVERTPNAIAVVTAGEKLTYAELNARANQLAHHLQSLGVGPETVVGLWVERSIAMVVGLLGILKAGGAYVPLDPAYPPERLAFMLQDSHALLLLTQTALQNKLPIINANLVYLDGDEVNFAAKASTNPINHVQTENLAYVIYTSGSTGQPKGVMVQHRNILALLFGFEQVAPKQARLVGTAVCPYGFDVSVWEFFSVLCFGGSLHVLTIDTFADAHRFADYIAKQAVTSSYIPPALLQSLAEAWEQSPAPFTLERMLVGVEPIKQELLQRFRRLSDKLSIVNGYGPTESTICATFFDFNKANEPEQRTPIGRAVAGYQVYLLNELQQIVPVGVSGELYIGGDGLARGYLNRPELTAERFIEHPAFGRLYKTGDLCRWLPDGNLEYLSRMDHQVKLRGFRIELGEIEAVLTQHPDVQEAVVVAREDTPGEKRLVAYVVTKPETREQQGETHDSTNSCQSQALRRHLQAKLPDYMLPSAFVELERLPLTANGKLDRCALPAPVYVDRQSEFVAPRTALEAQVAAIWQELLHIERVGVYDNFFALGGHSLLATQVIAKIQRVFAIELELSTLFVSPTIAAQTQALLARQQEASEGASQTVAADRFPEIVHAPAQRHDPFPLTDVQYAYWVGRSAGFELGNVSAHLYVELEAEQLDVVRLNQAWQRLVERHEMLRCLIQPDGQQRILPTAPRYEFALVNLQNVDESAATQTLGAIRAEMSHQILPADQWPLFDIRVTRLNPTSYRLHISLDALILDGTSIGTLLREWVELYQQPQTMLTPLTVSFRDYVFAERTFEQSATYQRAWAYWQKRLPTLPPAPDLPLVQEAQAIQQPHFTMYRFQLAATAWSQLKRYGNEAGLTNSTIILSAFAEILTAWSKEPHYTLNLTLFNRLALHPQINDILGDFTPLLLLEVDHRPQETGAETFATRAQRIQQQLWRDLDHRVVNGVRVLRELAKRQDRGANHALMPVVFTSMLATPLDNTFLDSIGTLGYMNSQTPQVWLDHAVIEAAGALDLSWSVVEELFPAGMVADMFDAYCALLQRLATDETAWHTPTLTTLPVVQQAQRQTVNDTTAPIADQMLHTLFLKQVDGYATAPAIIAPKMTLTYAELYQRANQIGHWLRQAGAKPNTLVGVVMEKGWEQVVAVIGIHLAGAAYLPIDPDLPTERQHYLLGQGMAKLALTQSHVDMRLTWPQAITRLQVDTLTPDASLPPLSIVQMPTDLAYVIYTSGSTGQPKGVVIDHRGAVNTVLDVNHRYGITANDRVLALSALNFDLSVYDIFGLLAVGGSLVMPDPERRTAPDHWHELIHQQQVTLWNTVPALMQMLVEYEEETSAGRALPAAPLRTIMMSGDWIPVTLPDRIRALYPAARVYSLGGATEASIWSIDYPIAKVNPAWPSIPYGKPMVNQTFHVLDANLNPRPTWVPGNLYIGGIGLALGYWQDEARTNASFITHPQSGKRLYKTGDLGRYLPDGNIEFLGREDFQVKIRGHRIELGEIESALLQHQGVTEAVVNAVGDPKGQRQLVGYVVLDEAWQAANQSKDSYAVNQALPDVYDNRQSVVLTDPVDRLEFKLRQPGIRELNRAGAVVLPIPAFDESRRQRWLARQSHRQFLDDAIDLHRFSEFLSCLMQMPMAERPLPKYRYPSAGNLYPVQCYLYVKPERITGLAGGYYYYQPADHQLIPLQVDAPPMQFATRQADQASLAQPAFILFLVADLAAIAPMYGELARDFSLLEAGYISQLLMMEAPQYALGLCPLGGIDQSTLQAGLALSSQHQLLHSLMGGRIDPQRALNSATPPVKTQNTQQTASSSWQSELQAYLAKKLPAYMVPTTLVALPALPLTANGKVDRKALPIPAVKATATGKFTPPSTETEQLIANLWCELLGVQQVGIHDDFFALGGDSLIVTQVRTRLRASTQLDLPLRTFFEHTTLYQLAEEIEGYRVVHKMQSSQIATNSVSVEIDREEVVW